MFLIPFAATKSVVKVYYLYAQLMLNHRVNVYIYVRVKYILIWRFDMVFKCRRVFISG